jgi:hypothetical protein
MPDPHPEVCLRLTLLPGRHPVAGSLAGPGGERAFEGWLELWSLIESHVEASAGDRPAPAR